MINSILFFKSKVVLSFLALSIYGYTYSQLTIPFDYTGNIQTYEVPCGVSSIFIQAWGAGGSGGGADSYGGAVGGAGSYIETTLQVTTGEIITIIVGGGAGPGATSSGGGGGPNGWGNNTFDGGRGGNAGFSGGSGGGGGGGGGTAVISSNLNLVMVAAGGGGGSGGGQYSSGAIGGAGDTNGNLSPGSCNSPGISGASLSGVGLGGVNKGGGDGGGGGGGGGGYRGGGGGGIATGCDCGACGGGGGTSWADPSLVSAIQIGLGQIPGNNTDINLPVGNAVGGGTSTAGGNGFVMITLPYLPDGIQANFSVTDNCVYDTAHFTDLSTLDNGLITNWEWDFNDQSPQGTTQNPNHLYLTDGTFQPTLIVTSANGCKDTIMLLTNRFPKPVSSFTALSQCLHIPLSFTNNSTINTPDNISGYIWNFGDGSALNSDQTPSHSYSSVGDYNVTLIANSNNGCIDTLSQLVTVFPLPQVGFSASTVCVNGEATQFVNTSTISSGIIALNGWSFGDGGTSLQESPTHNYQIAASYPVTLVVLSDQGCTDSVTFSIEVLGKPSAGFTQDTTNGCPPICIAFTDTSYDDIPITNWNWMFENNYGESIEQHPTYCYSETGNYDVGLIITNEQGCKDTLENISFITIFPMPISDFILSPTSTNVLNSTIDFTNNSTDAAAWVWDFGDGSATDFSNYDPSHLYLDSGHFEIQLIVINSFLCSDTSYQNVEILPVDDLFVPSAFSPNGDGKNDVLYARGYIGVMYFAIFDRLGKKVFESKDKEIGWDGLINGKKSLAGVYTWYLQAEVNGNPYKLKGDVTLVR